MFIEDSAVEPITTDLAPGFEAHEMWGLDDTATVPVADPPRATTSYYPPVNGVRFQVITIPPDGAATPEDLDLGAALEQLERAAPGITAYNETNDPGMHTTDTVDYVYIASGDICLEVDDGAEVELHAGDTIVQQGNRHAWRNRGDKPCVIVGTLVGAHRVSPANPD